MKQLVLVTLLASLISICSGLYFHIAETERKCFIEEIPDETTVIGKFKFLFLNTLIWFILIMQMCIFTFS